MKNKTLYCSLFTVHCLLFTIYCSLFTVHCTAQTLPLDSVLSRVEHQNLGVQAYENKINAANALSEGAGAWMPPVLSVEADRTGYPLNFNNELLRPAIRQDFPNPAKINARRTYLQSLSQTEEHGQGMLINQLRTQAKSKYYSRYIAEKRLVVIDESLRLLDIVTELAEKQISTSQGNLQNVYRMKARRSEALTMRIHEQNMIRAYTANLNYLMNRPLSDTFAIDTNQLVKNYRSLSILPDSNMLAHSRSDVMLMDSKVTSMQLNLKLKSLQNRPEYGLRFEHFQNFKNMPTDYSVIAMMTLPFVPWAAKGYKADIKAMQYNVQAMQQERQNMLNMAMQMAQMTIIELQSEYAELDNYTINIIPTYKKALQAILLSYGQNTSDLMQSLMAWDDLQMAKMEYLRHLDTLLKVQTDYEKEMQIR